MSPRYLIGPVSAEWVQEHLADSRQSRACFSFAAQAPADLVVTPDDTRESLVSRLPAVGQLDAIVVILGADQIPTAIWSSPLPIIALVRDWRRHWHAYRRIVRHCDLVLTDADGVAAFQRAGIDHARAVNLSGIGRSWLEFAWPGTERDIDVLVVGEPDRLPRFAHLAALGSAWNVVIASGVSGDEYRLLLARSKILLSVDDHDGRAGEAVAAGTLLFQEMRGRDARVLRDREECVLYDDDTLDELLVHYLRNDAQRSDIIANAKRRLPELTFAVQWDITWSAIASDLSAIKERAANRRATGGCPDLLTRTWMQLSCTIGSDPTLTADLREAVKERPREAQLHNAIGVVALSTSAPQQMPGARVEAANAFQEAWRSDPRHVVAGLNLTEMLLAMGQTKHADEQARRTLAMLDQLEASELALLDGPHASFALDELRVEWERAAWSNAGQPADEGNAKLVLLRRRLHQVLAQLHDDIAHTFIAASLRPDLFVSQAWLGSALARKGHLQEALPYLRSAVATNPFDADAARTLYETLGRIGQTAQQQRLARQRRTLSEAAPGLVPREPWYAERELPVILSASSPLRIAWHGSQDAVHSLALVNRELCVRLAERGHELSLQPPRSDPPGTRVSLPTTLQTALRKKLAGPADFNVSHQWPPDFTPPRDGHWIIIQPWEFGSLPRAWLEPMTALVDDVWVPSQFVRDGFLRSGLSPERVHVVPNGVSEPFLRDGHAPYPLQTKKRFKFLFVGGTIERKGIDLLLKAYTQSFSDRDDVCLVIKDMGVGTFYQGQTAEQTVAQIRQAPHAPEIQYLPSELSVEEMASLYIACDCLVHPYRGEGFGLPIAEAMACGLPVIITGYGAALDFCRDEHASLLPATVVQFRDKRVGNIETVDRPWWAEPDVDALRLSLHRAVENTDAARAKAKHGQAFIREHFTWEHAAAVAEERLYELKKRPVKRQRYVPADVPTVHVTGPRPKVTLAMIVKNEESNLPACLQSVADLVNEIVIIDTGSTDATKRIATERGARVFDFPWVDSFSAARNESLRHATGEWVFWMDADDRLDDVNRAKLKTLFANLPNANVGFVMKCLCLSESKNETVVDHVRLFRNHPEIRWTFRIHEQILPAIRKLGGEVRWSDVVIRHVGYMDSNVRKGKLDRDLRLLTMEFQEQPENPFTLFNLASVYQEQGRIAEGLDFFRRSLQRSAPEDSIVRKLYAQIGQCHRQLGQANEALQACQAGRKHYPDDLEILFQEALAHRDVGNRPAAIACLERILAERDGAHFASVDTGLRGYKTRHNLAVFLQEEGRLDDAEKNWQQALAEQPMFIPALVGLAEIRLTRGDWPAFAEILTRLRDTGHGHLDAIILEARKELTQRQFTAARAVIAQAIAQSPQAVTPRVILTHILLQEGTDWPAAEKAIRDVLALVPNHAEARRNLDVLLRQQNR